MPHTDWTNKPVTILGLSKTGIASAEYLAQKGAACLLSETVPASPTNKDVRERLLALGVELEMGAHTARCFDHSDLVVVSPGIPPSSQILKELTLSGKTVISEIELAYRETEKPIVAITGTNGKTTTTALLEAIFTQAGLKGPACGNYGIPMISLVPENPDVFVAELSSFQLAFSPTLKAKIAIFTNFRPDHLDWHGSVEAYKRAKFVLFEGEHSPEWAVLNADDPVCRELETLTKANIVWFSRNPEWVSTQPNYMTIQDGQLVMKQAGLEPVTVLSTQDIPLVGAHNQENVLAAVAAALLQGVSPEAIRQAVKAFPGVEHRLEPVATIQGVLYYNDSKATNPDATLSALSAFIPKKVVLIAGGRDKKTDLAEFVDSVSKNATEVILLGEARERFAEALRQSGYMNVSFATDLSDALRLASQLAKPETPVLFSPACASFDMFANYEVRGKAFKEAVLALNSALVGA